MDEMLFRVLAEGVSRYLEAVERASGTEIRRMAAAWRALLRLHIPAGGRCRGCRPRRGAMCGVWRVAAGFFLQRFSDDPPSGPGMEF